MIAQLLSDDNSDVSTMDKLKELLGDSLRLHSLLKSLLESQSLIHTRKLSMIQSMQIHGMQQWLRRCSPYMQMEYSKK